MAEKKQVGLIGLITIVWGAMIGGGIFNLPKEIAITTSAGAAIIGWIISGVGVFFIGKTFQILALKKPDIDDGIYSYAKIGFGRYAGFNSAWGYWIGNVLGNAAYAVMTVNALTYFFPSLSGASSIQGMIVGSIFLWGIVYLVNCGIKEFDIINSAATFAKLLPLFFAVVILWIGMKHEIFFGDFWGKEIHVGNVFTQIKGCMLQTLWCFVGIEGAVVISGRARDEKQVGVATLLGYALSLFLYVIIVLMSYGVLPREELAKVHDPALAYIVERVVGKIGAVIVNVGVLISVLGAWLSWTLLTAEIPFNVTTEDKLFPKFLAHQNKEESATGALLVNGAIKQIAFLLGIFTGNAWLAISNAATSMILVPYLFSCLYLVKVSKEDGDKSSLICGILGSIYGVWMLYAQGFTYLAQSGFIYALGLIFLVQCSKENNTAVFVNKYEKVAAICVSILGIWGIYTLLSSIIS